MHKFYLLNYDTQFFDLFFGVWWGPELGHTQPCGDVVLTPSVGGLAQSVLGTSTATGRGGGVPDHVNEGGGDSLEPTLA